MRRRRLADATELGLQIATEQSAMTRIPSWLMASIAVVLAVLGGRAISAQDKYTVQVPNGLAFSEIRDTKTGRLSSS